MGFWKNLRAGTAFMREYQQAQYGSWPTPPEFLRNAPPGAASPAAAPPGLRESRLKILQVHLRQGTITQEEYSSTCERWGSYVTFRRACPRGTAKRPHPS
jgi:soluble lytic murein transglycosylase-like protein